MKDIVTIQEKYIMTISLNKLFVEQNALLPLNLKGFNFFWQYHLKSEGRNVPEPPDIIKAPKTFLAVKIYLNIVSHQ